MSIIIKDEQGKIILLCKGADSIIEERLSAKSRDSQGFKKTQESVNVWAEEGLRTLFLAEKYLDPKTYNAWN